MSSVTGRLPECAVSGGSPSESPRVQGHPLVSSKHKKVYKICRKACNHAGLRVYEPSVIKATPCVILGQIIYFDTDFEFDFGVKVNRSFLILTDCNLFHQLL